MKKIVFFGDSVTEAYRDILNSSDLGEGFVYHLSKEFKRIQFFNMGIGGQRVKDLLNRVEQDVISLAPNICFIWIGTNDAWLPHMLNQTSSLKSYSKDYEQLIKYIKSKRPHMEIVLIKPYALLSEKVSLDIIKDLNIFRDACEKLGLKYKLNVIDIKKHIENQLLTLSSDKLFYDGIHPTPFGYVQISNILKIFIKGNQYDI